jgi:signal transduction histidine kinase
VIADHHGTITVSSTPGRGTTFHIELPVRQLQDAKAEERTAAAPVQTT